MTEPVRIAAIIPCHNEEAAIATVVADVRAVVPEAEVFVYDNASTDATARVASEAGAWVRTEEVKGKGNVVRRAFADIDADIYILIDGDDTYAVEDLPSMIDKLQSGPYDHVLGVRTKSVADAYRRGHELGNRGFNWLVGGVFRTPVSDMLSGYRVFSRRFIKSFPALAREFEIETELTVHAMSLRVPQAEVPVGFKDRPAGSESKLRTYRDGMRILSLVASLIRHERPMLFYGVMGALLALVGLAFGTPVVIEFALTGTVERFPTAFLALGIVIVAFMSWMIGLILDGVLKARREISRLNYLSHPAPPFQRPLDTVDPPSPSLLTGRE